MIDRRLMIAGGLSTALAAGFSLTSCSTNRPLRLIGEDSSNMKAIQSLFDGFEKQSGVHVAAELLDFVTMGKQADIDLAQNGGGRYDIVCQYNFSLTAYARNRYVLDIAELKRAASGVDFGFEKDIRQNVWHELGYYAPPGKPIGSALPIAYPFSANTMVLVYNKRVLADRRVKAALDQAFGGAFDIPRQWTDLVRAALAVAGVDRSLHGIALQGAVDDWLYYEWVNFLFGLGGKVMDKPWGWASGLDTPLQLRSPKVTEATELYLALKPANAGDFLTVDATQQRDLMLEGKTAFAIMWTDYIPEIAAQDKDGFGFAPVPGPHSMIAGGSYFVSRKSGQPANSAALIAYLMQPAMQKRLALAGLFPPTLSVFNDPDVLALPYMPAVRQSLDRAIYMNEAGPDAHLISAEIGKALQDAWRGKIRADEVGPRATDAILDGRNQLAAGTT
jgi:spermidine/putrescine-binding protein